MIPPPFLLAFPASAMSARIILFKGRKSKRLIVIIRVSTMGALAVDLYIARLARQGGRHFRLDDMDRKRSRAPAIRGPYTDTDHHDVSDEDLPRNSEAFEVPQQGYGAQASSRRMQAEGYALPENQFDYDTGYHGRQDERLYASR